jgi:pyruvate dehydrogenase E1 component beta subunit
MALRIGQGAKCVLGRVVAGSRLVDTSSRSVSMTVREALNSALDEEMERDSRVFIMGEEASSVIQQF